MRYNTHMPDRILLIDSTGLIFRAYWTIKGLSAPDGTPVNAVFGMLRLMMKVFKDVPVQASAMIFDAGIDTFRREMYKEYKANRPAPPEDLRPQFGLSIESCRCTGAPVYAEKGFEADDIIATIRDKAVARGMAVTVITGDRDILQLLAPNVEVWVMKGAGEFDKYTVQRFEDEFGFPVERFVDYKALMGDTSDNIPGLPGVGPKTAQKLIAGFGKLEQIYANLDLVKPDKVRGLLKDNKDNVFLYRELVTLHHEVPVDYDFAGRVLPDFGSAELDAKLESMGFNRIRDDAKKLGDLQAAAAG
jgi:DNA polymerase-1